MKSETSKWIFYNLIVCFAVYWLSNLILWYPWSVNETLGQILMLTVNPILWGVASYSCIIRYPKENVINGVFLNGFLFLIEAIISDLIFFVVIRNAGDKLMHVTTLYAWGFVLSLPFIIYYLFRKSVRSKKTKITASTFWKPLLIGFFSLTAIVVIILFNIQFQ
ncbi:MAG: hypothetical protein EOP48_02115 [Sphingobacteriales bacterium]|nr:MAG: hypothetical protein EOP48_02115 [Sphingobacteriales bacterium]